MSDSEDEEYDALHGDEGDTLEQRFPIHDACEFDDIETLRRLLFVQIPVGSTEARPNEDSSSSDDNDSTAAAHAAAIGHSPQPMAKNVAQQETTRKDEHDAVVPTEESKKISSNEPNDPRQQTSSEAMQVDTNDNTSNIHHQEKQDTNGTTTESKRNEAAMTAEEQLNYRHKVNYSVNVNERDFDENTPLHIAIHARRLEIVKILLEAGASFKMKSDGSWPLHTAISMGALKQHRQFAYECTVVLHEAGADLTAKDDSNHTPLYLASIFNLPQVVSYILSTQEGLSTLNARGDRAGNRALHAAAKFDTICNPSFGRSAAASVTGQTEKTPHHHAEDTISTVHPNPLVTGKLAAARVPAAAAAAASSAGSTEAVLTQVLLGTVGIEVDAPNATGQTALHIACMRGNWPVIRLLLQAGASPNHADRRGFTPGQLAHKRGMPIPNDLLETLGDAPESGIIPPPRDLIVDPDSTTLVLSHELCVLHRTCPPIRRDADEPPPENVRRLYVLLDEETGILRTGEFGNISIKAEARRAAMTDILKVHEYTYVESISQMASSIPDIPNAIAHVDADTTISRWSFEAAMRAAGSVCQAVDHIIAGDYRNAFCAVRPPGHHAGPRGIVRCANDPEGGSHGFCLLNNVAIGAAYARSMYRNEGIKKVAIIDFDVHHGNGTEEIIRRLLPTIERAAITTPFGKGEMVNSSYRPWLDETDVHNVFFASCHGYGNRGFEQPGWFYPASGKNFTSEAITHPAMVESPNLTDFILSQTWARMGEDSKTNCCKIIDVGLDLPEPDIDPIGRSMKQRLEVRDTYRHKIFPYLREFDPDLIFVSAGFDAHRRDSMNFGYVGMVEDDYEWVTEQLVKIANTCCNGRIISVLEGGYKVHGGLVSPFARSVASHVRAFVDGSRSRELYDPKDLEWESQYERHLYERRERKREEERERLRLMQEATRASLLEQITESGGVPEDPDAPTRKRRRNQVDYKELFKQMQEEGFGQ